MKEQGFFRYIGEYDQELLLPSTATLKKEKPVVRQAFFTNLTRKVMPKIVCIKPSAFYVSKWLMLWIIVASVVVAILMLGIGDSFLPITDQVLLAAAYADESEEPAPDKGDRYITLSASTNEESGEPLASGSFYLMKTEAALIAAGFDTQGTGTYDDPTPMYMLMSYMLHYNTDLFRFPLAVGNTWTQKGHREAQVQTIVEGYEAVEVSAGTFPDCLKHKIVITEAKAGSPLRSSLVNGTRYLWFAKGVGIVKMRYEHASGTTTGAELLEYNIPVKGEEYFPLQVGNAWTYKWQNDYRNAIIEKCEVVENSDKQPGSDGDMTVPESVRMMLASARYEVTIEAEERRMAHIKCVLTPKEDTGEILPLSMSHFGTETVHNGYAEYIEDLRVTTADQEELPMMKLGKTRWAVNVGNASPVILRYKVLLNHDERQWPPGRSETPYVQEDCIFLPGYALFVIGEVNDVELRVNVPGHWYVSSPWHRIGDEGHRFTIEDQNDLIHAYMVLGTHSEKVAKSGETEVVVAVGGRFKANAAEVQSVVEAFLKTYSGVFNGTPKGRMLFVANPYGDPGRLGGGVRGRSISVLVGGKLDEASKRFWVPLVGHEVFHAWPIQFKIQEYWFSEGFTEYYSHIASARLGFTAESDFLQNLERVCESYLSQQGELSIREAGKNKSTYSGLVYQGGSLIALALDVQIRKLTQNQKSLDDVMKQMYSEFGATGEMYTMSDVVRIVTGIAGADFEPFFNKYVSGIERLPFAEYFGGAGLEVHVEEELPDIDYVRKEMLYIQSLTQTPVGDLIIHKSPTYQDGDNLIAISGTPVDTFNDIGKAAKGWESGDVVELTLERGDKEIILPITLGGTSGKPPLGSDIVAVTITKRRDSTDAQSAIFSGILDGSQ